ncbi:hypothetical protein SAY86_023351 [Trapa natans]|uniref:Fe2OG dioxygenase domain-containing protein n=1 Tax=Trapa natans TaxID=22666 RepID=A0AAN7RA44_TRANT|nr:hypothetical protein SAY86_023351 [Trapa natans]
MEMEGEKTEDEGFFFHEVSFVDRDGRLRTSRVPVVQELDRRGITQLPQRFVQLKPGDSVGPTQCCTGSETLQTIDLSMVRDGSAEELAKLAEAAKQQGMFLIKGHGVDSSVLDEVEAVVKGFFGLSFEEKKSSVGSYGSADNMGYGRNFVKSEDQPLDWIDRLAIKALPKGATDGLNVWPHKPANFRRAMETYVDQSRNVLDQVLVSLAESFSLDKHAFLHQFDPQGSEMNVRVNYYPPCPRPDLALGITPHTDASALTLLTQISHGTHGLQVFRGLDHDLDSRSGWRTVVWPSGALLVIVGDLFEIISDGRGESPWHRVVTQADAERMSIALFYNPAPESEISPVKGGSGTYRKVVAGEYRMHLYGISPTKKKEAILHAKKA